MLPYNWLSGLILAEGKLWKEQRKWAMHTLHDLGVGQQSFEVCIHDELRELVEHLRALEGRSIDPSLPIIRSVTNMICALVFGQRLGNHPKIDRFSKLITNELHRNTKIHPLAYMFGRLCSLLI